MRHGVDGRRRESLLCSRVDADGPVTRSLTVRLPSPARLGIAVVAVVVAVAIVLVGIRVGTAVSLGHRLSHR